MSLFYRFKTNLSGIVIVTLFKYLKSVTSLTYMSFFLFFLLKQSKVICRFVVGEQAVWRDKMSPGSLHAASFQLGAYLAFKPP